MIDSVVFYKDLVGGLGIDWKEKICKLITALIPRNFLLDRALTLNEAFGKDLTLGRDQIANKSVKLGLCLCLRLRRQALAP